jgi:hypothetical protein
MQSSPHSTQSSLTSVQANPPNQSLIIGNTILGCGGILLFIGLIVGAILHKRRRVDRTSDLERQIEMLERIWRLPSKPLDR